MSERKTKLEAIMRMSGVVYAAVLILALVGAAVPSSCVADASPGVIYVDADATGANDGTSWENAFNYLQDALAAAEDGDEVWAADGTYKPDQGAGNAAGDRSATFLLIDGVTIYGGFAGYETSLGERDWDANRTILSGDLAGNDGPGPFDNNTENSHHVVSSWLGPQSIVSSVLDGLIITGGNASAEPHWWGGGVYSQDSSLTLANCTLVGNEAVWGGGIWSELGSVTLTDCTLSGNEGGGLINVEASATLSNCTFHANSGGGIDVVDGFVRATDCRFVGNEAEYGGGLSSSKSIVILTNCIFSGNRAMYGGGMSNTFHCDATLTNCTFSGNEAQFDGGGVYSSEEEAHLTVANCIFSGNSDSGGTDESAQIHVTAEASAPVINYSCLQGWTGALGGADNSGDAALLADPGGADGTVGTMDDDLHLSPGSPCVDAGDDGAIPDGVTSDHEGNPRFLDGDLDGIAAVDMGAFEYVANGSLQAVVDFDPDVLNLRAPMKYVTVYTELPTGYELSQMDMSSIRLNGTVPALAAPTNIGDHDGDGVPDLMVKYDGSAVRSILNAGDQVEILINGEVSGLFFEGTDTVRVRD